MTRVLVTGGTGTLGRHAVAALERGGASTVRLLTRRERPADAPPQREWCVADLRSDPLDAAVRDVDAVLHLASAKGEEDVPAAQRLLEAARPAGVRHLVFVSIIGCDRIPLPFYGTKVRVEEAVRAGGVPWTIARVAQFHSFVERLVRAPASLPIPSPIVADLRFQPVDEGEAAARLAEIALGPPLGVAPEIAGPEVLTLGAAAEAWRSATGRRATTVAVPLDAIGAEAFLAAEPWARAVLEGYRAAWNTPHGARTLGSIRFVDWLRARPPGG